MTILWIAFPLYQRIFIKLKNWKNTKAIIKTDNSGLMLFSSIALWIMAGALLPSSTIATSPTEFSFLGSVDSPLTYIFMNLTFYFGLFVFWPLCIYKMFQKQMKNIFPALFFGITVCAVFNIYLFKSRFGNITTAFEPEDKQLFVSTSNSYVWHALLPVALSFIICFVAFRYYKQHVLKMLLIILIVTECILSGKNMITMKQEYDIYAARLEEWQTDDTEQELTERRRHIFRIYWSSSRNWRTLMRDLRIILTVSVSLRLH